MRMNEDATQECGAKRKKRIRKNTNEKERMDFRCEFFFRVFGMKSYCYLFG